MQIQILGTHRFPPDPHIENYISLGDVNGDGLIDAVAAGSPSPTGGVSLYLQDISGLFSDATQASIPALPIAPSLATCLSDIDNDGDLDLVVGGPYEERLLLNDGRGRFADVTANRFPPQYPPDATGELLSVDFDRNGYPDVLAVSWPRCRLFMNFGGVFRDEASVRLAGQTSAQHMAAATGDFDRDGDLDLMITAENQPKHVLWLNDGSGVFSDASGALPPNQGMTGRKALAADVDADGDLDLVLGNGTWNNGWLLQPPSIYENDGYGRFRDRSNWMPTTSGNSFCTGLALVDLEEDGRQELVVSHYVRDRNIAYQVAFYRLSQSGYTEISHLVTPARTDWGALACGFGDIDWDGDLDVVYAGINQTSVMLNLRRQLVMQEACGLGQPLHMATIAEVGHIRGPVPTGVILSGAATMPVPLPPLGHLLVDLSWCIIAYPLAIIPPDQFALHAITVPPDPRLVGRLVYGQSFTVHPYPGPSVRLGNRTPCIVTR